MQTKVIWLLKFSEVGGWDTLIPNSPKKGVFVFSQSYVCPGLGTIFGTFC